MRMLDEATAAAFAAETTTIARCWRVQRKDGVVLGFTDHDRPLSFEDMVFRPDTGLGSTAIERATGLSVDNGAVMGALSDAEVTEADLDAGLYDDAEVTHWLVDWTAPAQRVEMFRARIGEIRRGRSGFEAELRGLSEVLNRPVGRAMLRECDALVGDARCKVDLDQPAYRGDATVLARRPDGRFEVSGLGSFEAGWFEGGTVTFADSLTVAVKSDVIERGVRLIGFWQDETVAAGTAFTVRAGCDRRSETCKAKFANFLNFRGFPHVPGEDWGVGYPVDGERHDGGSLFRGAS